MTAVASIGPYRVVRPLGHGGMGEVSLAYDDRLKRHVALKTLLSTQPGHRTALLHEARNAAALSHPGIAGIYDILEEGDRTYIVMEYVEGETLASRLARGPLREPEATDLALQLCDALGAAHERRIIHHDLKPGNIMIGPQQRAKILDFGLARRDTSATVASTTVSAVHGNIGGTIGYIAPEQMLGREVDHRADLYSLGAVLFEMFTGRRAFTDRDALAYALSATQQGAPAAQDVNASVGDGTAAILARALAIDPDRRYASASDIARDLRAASAGAAVVVAQPLLPSTKVPAKKPASSWRTAAAVGTLTLLIGAALASVLWPAPGTPMGTADAPAVLAILPVLTFDAEPTTDAIGTGIAATVFSNLSGTSGLNVIPLSAVSQAAAGGDRNAALKSLGVQWVLDTTLRRTNADFTLDAALKQPGAAEPGWRTTVAGSALTTERRLMDSLARGLASAGVVRTVSSSDRARIVRAPTSDNDAFVAYSQGRRLYLQPWSTNTAQQMIALFEQATSRDPQYALAFAGLSEAYVAGYRQTKDALLVDKAGEAAQRALALDPTQAAVQVSLANLWMQTGRMQDALAAVDRAIGLLPASDDAQRLRGRILSTLGRRAEAFAALSRAIALNPSRMNNHETMGFVQYQAGNLKEAAAAYQRVTEIAPNYAAGFEMLGAMHHLLGDTTQAIGNYEHAVRLGASANAFGNLAYSYYEAGRFDEALKAYLTTIERDPNNPEAMRNLGDVYTRLSRNQDARLAYARAIEVANAQLRVNPSTARLIALVALCEAKLGQRADAERHAAEALALAPKDRHVLVRNAEVYARLRQSDRALRYLGQAMGLGYEAGTARRNDEFEFLKASPAFETTIAMQTAPRG